MVDIDDTDRVNTLYRKHKAALTWAKKTGDPERIIKVCDTALADFDRTGLWPDQWALWETARLEAQLQLGSRPLRW